MREWFGANLHIVVLGVCGSCNIIIGVVKERLMVVSYGFGRHFANRVCGEQNWHSISGDQMRYLMGFGLFSNVQDVCAFEMDNVLR